MELTDDGARRPGLTPAPNDPRKLRDMLLVVVVCAAVALALVAVDAVDHIYHALAARDATALLVGLILIPIGVSVFAFRRFQAAEEVWKETARLSMRDPLTGLPTRRFLSQHFREVVRRVQRHGGRVAVFFCDLDKFKQINDTYGHEMGDQVMTKVAERMAAIIEDDDILIRYGGDEFVVISPNAGTRPTAEAAAGRLIDALEAPFAVGEDKIQLSVCIGVALTEEHCSEPDDVLRDADAAMYKAKAAGGGQVAIYDRSMANRITPSTAERRLRMALAEEQFRLYYQPVVSLQTQRMVKVEALIRWEDPERGIVSPGEFIPALENTGLIVPVGTWVLEQACRQAHEWARTYRDQVPLMVTVNVSARQLAQADFGEVLRRVLGETGVDPGTICLEITEGAVMADVDAAWTMLRSAKALGVYLALDDFGTGFSSLSFLQKFRPGHRQDRQVLRRRPRSEPRGHHDHRARGGHGPRPRHGDGGRRRGDRRPGALPAQPGVQHGPGLLLQQAPAPFGHRPHPRPAPERPLAPRPDRGRGGPGPAGPGGDPDHADAGPRLLIRRPASPRCRRRSAPRSPRTVA